ncbi:MAG: Arm DNA-binding domain-containing protein [Desulfovibrio sp.]|nr:Arm DNA-binding domain-containing protein [Desulfovibrio sp.]
MACLGVYPAVSLKDARQKAVDSKEQLAKGIDPGEVKSKPRPSLLQRQKKPPQHLRWWRGSGMRKRCLSFQ